MLGTAGAYGYRTYYAAPTGHEPAAGDHRRQRDPDQGRSLHGDRSAIEQGMDRLATAASNEQLVRRQEEPVALRSSAPHRLRAWCLPAPVSRARPASSASAARGAPLLEFSEPKRVRTVTIRPDGTDISGRPVGAPPSSTAVTPPAPRAAAPTAHPRRRHRGPRTGAQRRPDLARAAAAPSETPPREPRPAAGARPNQRRSTRRAAPKQASASAGGYLVQLSSQRSEGEAQSAYRSLQAKFPNELGDRQPVIRRADLGSKGVYYRTMVGPFRSAQEASQFCASYKAAGGQCVVSQ